MAKKSKLIENIKLIFLPTLIKYGIIAIYKTLKIKMVNYPSFLSDYDKQTPIIFVFWHGDMFMMPCLGLNDKKKKNISIMTSRSRDGELMTRVLNKFGYLAVRGSSSRGGLQGLLNLMNNMKKGSNTAIAVDGPRGPYHIVKPGVILLAKKIKATIIPLAVKYNKRIIFKKSWDKSEVPLPFSTVYINWSEPIKINPDANKEDMEKYRSDLENILNSLKE